MFIKPLPRTPSDKASYDTADTFLRAIAAQCLPIMKGHHLSVTTLAEHEPNREFIGRNFNNGEIIELVLRTHGGGWVSFQMVQMVMMHELAHNVHMNHGKGFWQTRNLFSKEMKDLWNKNYTGEGFWGGGRVLGDLSSFMGNNVVPSEELQDIEICGGTFRSRRKKRKNAGPDLTWKEKRDRRIEKKFGKNGQALGDDEDQRLRLEIGRKGPIGAKPRVAGSKRGRELRAAAALARFAPNKQEVNELKETGEGEDSDEGEYEEVDELGEDALDSNGQKMLDGNGKTMIRVCSDEDGTPDEAEVQSELKELEGLESHFMVRQQDGRGSSEDDDEQALKWASGSEKRQNGLCKNPDSRLSPQPKSPNSHAVKQDTPSSEVECAVCTTKNNRLSPTCLVCAHVLDESKVPNHWVCKSENCQAIGYVNAGDCGVCGACGSRKM